MNIIANIFRILVRTRLIVFVFTILLCLDGWIYFYYPKYRFEQDVQAVKKSFTHYFDFISEIIEENPRSQIIEINQLISYLKFHPDLRYVAIPNIDKHILYPKGLFPHKRIETMPVDAISYISGQQILNLKMIPSLKHDYKFKNYYLGINAEKIIENQNKNYKDAVLVIVFSLFLFGLFVAIYFLDFYKPLGKLNKLHHSIDPPGLLGDEYAKLDKGVLRLKSRLVNRRRELKSVNNILATTIKSQRNFIKVISHDLKAPLRNVSGLVDSIHRKYPKSLNPDISNRLSRIKKNVDNERQMISDILRSITSQKKILAYEKVDVQNIIDSILGDFDFEIQSKHIQIQIKGELPRVYSSQIILRHVFQNLLDNACKYFPEHGDNKIEIECKDNRSEYIFSVMDTGPGIPKEKYKTIFHPFEYNQPLSMLENIDSGLGLQLVSTFIEIINGKIWFESKIGKGSTFYISLNKLDDTKAGIFQ